MSGTFSSVTVRMGTKIGGECGVFVGVGVKSSEVHSELNCSE